MRIVSHMWKDVGINNVLCFYWSSFASVEIVCLDAVARECQHGSGRFPGKEKGRRENGYGKVVVGFFV